MTTVTILFDEACPLCRNLAMLAARKAGPDMAFAGWQTFTGRVGDRPEALGLWDGQTLASGAAAWESLLTRHPALAVLGWAAARLNLTHETSAALSSTSRFIRNLCTRCGRSAPRKQQHR